jgi:vacuolar-type H+-ATPase subunit I/STV1
MSLENLDLPDEVKEQLTSLINEEAKRIADPLVEDTVKGLKAKNNELIGKLKNADESMLKLQQKMASDAPENSESVKQLNKALEDRVSSLQSTIEEMNEKARVEKINGIAGTIAARLTRDTARANLLRKEIAPRLTFVEDEARVLDESGQLTVSTIEELESSIKSGYPFLVDGIQAQGGGAARSDGQAIGRAKELSRAEFEAMNQSQRAEFFQSGGQLFDD